MRWRFFSKPEGLDLESLSAAGEGNNRFLRPFLFFKPRLFFEMIIRMFISAGNGKPNAVALTRAAASRNKGVGAKVR